ncbi:hypothetical protein BD408DRAFT_423779 [Parasitella parasitica]|nr:hypothetical protein BD408DRAFT_423779 [Parasitella parasitica]
MSHENCLQCEEKVSSNKHKYEYHIQTIDVQVGKDMQILKSYEINENGEFICPLCSRLYVTASSISKHLRNIPNKGEELSLTVVPRSSKPVIAEKQIEVTSPIFRNNNNAILNASGLIHRSRHEQVSSLKIIRALDLEPFTFVDSNNNEENALAHKDLHAKYLNEKKYFEMDDDTCKLLNNDWAFRPQMRFFCTRVLSGAILVNRMTGETLLINTIEAVRDPDGVKLLVGTKVFNGLVTSSTRIDRDLLPEVGPTTSNFVLNGEDAGMIEIYIDKTACSRGSSTDTNDHMIQPYTIWTYCNFDSRNDEYSDGRIASKLIHNIAIREAATVEEKMIRNLISQCKGEKVKECMENILDLFDESKQIKIIENKVLNDELCKLAVILNP